VYNVRKIGFYSCNAVSELVKSSSKIGNSTINVIGLTSYQSEELK